MSRKETREELMKVFYQIDMNENHETFPLDHYFENLEILVEEAYFKRTVQNYKHHYRQIDELIETYSTDWKINRIARIDLAILRLAVCEMVYDESIPESVSINEAVEICKKYSSAESHKFINGILGNISRNR